MKALDRVLLTCLTLWAVAGVLPLAAWTGVAPLAYYQAAWGMWARALLVVALLSALLAVVSRGRAAGWSRALLALAGRLRRRWFVALAAGAAVLEAVVVAIWCFARNPPVIDVWIQYFQARIFLSGALAAPPPPSVPHFGLLHTLATDRGWFAQFPPVHPALLAAGMAFGAAWLVTPLLAAPFTAAVYLLGRRTGDERIARLAAALSLFSPFAAAMSASGMNHVPAVLAVTVGLWAVPDLVRGQGRAGAIFGAATGLLFGLRPLDAAILAAIGAVGIGAGLLARRGMAALAGAAIAGLAMLAPTLLFNHATTGSALRFGYLALYGDSLRLGFHSGPWGAALTPWRALGLTALDAHQLNVYLLDWPLPVMALTALGLWRAGGRLDDGLRVAAAYLLGLVGALFFYFHRDTLFGPRLLFSALGPVFVLLAAALVRLVEAPREAHSGWGVVADGALVVLLVTATLAASSLAPARLASYRVAGTPLALHPERDAERAGLEHAVVLVPDGWGSRLVVRLWAAGIPMGESDRVYEAFDACALEERLTFAEEQGLGGGILAVRLRAEMPDADAGRVVPGVTRDPYLRLPADGRLTQRCADEIARDRRGTMQFAALAWLNAPSLDGNVVWAREMGPGDAVLRELYPDRAIYRYELSSAGEPSFTKVELPE